jgi:hypothetical protein
MWSICRTLNVCHTLIGYTVHRGQLVLSSIYHKMKQLMATVLSARACKHENYRELHNKVHMQRKVHDQAK